MIFNPYHFATCQSLINVSSPGVHNFVIESNNYAQVNVPTYYQVFIFSNIDMGMYNSFYLDEVFLPNKYRNMFAISFNGSSSIIIHSNYSSNQNMAVFIIPYRNCDQHSFYVMSKNIFKIDIESKNFNHNLRICGFSPSFVSDANRQVSFGYKNNITANAHIFYGFSLNSEANLLKDLNNSSLKRINLSKIKDHHLLNTNSKIESNKPNMITNIQSPGFLVSHSIDSEIQTFLVNTTYYVSYAVNQTNVGVKLKFDREFDGKNDDKVSDKSMLPSHFDFLLYYDKYSSEFIYDDSWVSKIRISYRGSDWETMKWAWIAIIVIFGIVIFIVAFFLFRLLRPCNRKCCCLKENEETNNEATDNNSENSENSGLRFAYELGDYAQYPYHTLIDRNENRFDSVIYSPNLDDEEIGYTNTVQQNDSDSSSTRKSGELDPSYYTRTKKNQKSSTFLSPYQNGNEEGSFDSYNENNCENEDEIPNPYELPQMKFNNDD